MSITVNLRYNGENGSSKEFANEMMKSGTVEATSNEWCESVSEMQ